MYKETNNLANPFERKETGEKETNNLICWVNVNYFRESVDCLRACVVAEKSKMLTMASTANDGQPDT